MDQIKSVHKGSVSLRDLIFSCQNFDSDEIEDAITMAMEKGLVSYDSSKGLDGIVTLVEHSMKPGEHWDCPRGLDPDHPEDWNKW